MVPVPASYLDHKKAVFTRGKLISFIKCFVKCVWKNVTWRKSNTLYCVCQNFCDSILLSSGCRSAKAKSYVSSSSGSGACSAIPTGINVLYSDCRTERLTLRQNEGRRIALSTNYQHILLFRMVLLQNSQHSMPIFLYCIQHWFYNAAPQIKCVLYWYWHPRLLQHCIDNQKLFPKG
jgi:hypothetical protein